MEVTGWRGGAGWEPGGRGPSAGDDGMFGPDREVSEMSRHGRYAGGELVRVGDEVAVDGGLPGMPASETYLVVGRDPVRGTAMLLDSGKHVRRARIAGLRLVSRREGRR